MKLPNFFESLLTEKEKLCESKYSTIFLLSVLAGVLLSSLLVIYGTLGFIADAFILLSPFSNFSFLHIIISLIFHIIEEPGNTAHNIFLITIIHIHYILLTKYRTRVIYTCIITCPQFKIKYFYILCFFLKNVFYLYYNSYSSFCASYIISFNPFLVL